MLQTFQSFIRNAVRLKRFPQPEILSTSRLFSTSPSVLAYDFNHANDENPLTKKRRWTERYNNITLPPQEPSEERRPAQVFHMRPQIKYSPDKMWYIAQMIRGLSIDEAIKQLTFNNKKGAKIVREVLLEAQELGINEHNFEFKSKMWVAESFCGKGTYIKGLRKHARGRYGIIHYKWCNYYVKLEEGDPPKEYYREKIRPKKEVIEKHLDKLRSRTVNFTY